MELRSDGSSGCFICWAEARNFFRAGRVRAGKQECPEVVVRKTRSRDERCRCPSRQAEDQLRWGRGDRSHHHLGSDLGSGLGSGPRGSSRFFRVVPDGADPQIHDDELDMPTLRESAGCAIKTGRTGRWFTDLWSAGLSKMHFPSKSRSELRSYRYQDQTHDGLAFSARLMRLMRPMLRSLTASQPHSFMR